jgi:ABC-2 type transport system permease protein
MLADAISSELYKLWRNRSTLFWGFCSVPLGILAFNLVLDTWMKLRSLGAVAAILTSAGAYKLDLGAQLEHSLSLGGSSLAQIFYVVGAASLFGSEYRWETWRLLTPRNSRANLLLAKVVTYGLMCALSLMGLAIVSIVLTIYESFLYGVMPTVPTANVLISATVIFVISLIELLIMGLLVALIAVGSRAMVAALFGGILFSLAQTIGMVLAHPWDAQLVHLALLPSLSAYLLRIWASHKEIAPNAYVDQQIVIPACVSLLSWVGVLTGATISVFQKQDLPRE